MTRETRSLAMLYPDANNREHLSFLIFRRFFCKGVDLNDIAGEDVWL